ncbi:hypothetical protein G3T14_05380 [Methylobacterium sp. BTF04]|uniref:hypothetical protein n=1 Tax=Methylobacterium sp. BTF04 TaxID=2708300 RepID=UPI0013D2B625|nr:hypothetical protein [Methylobacterium sp. BTF04]NEU11558.1 hypothetical protein [Methylobacterium sp. BTF04]
MEPAQTHTENSAPNQPKTNSDLRAVKLQLLSIAAELCHRQLITAECSLNRELQQKRISLFGDAEEMLVQPELFVSLRGARFIKNGLKVAYDVYSANAAHLDDSFRSASYGDDHLDEYLSLQHWQ